VIPQAYSMKILLFGKAGQLGWEFRRTLAPLGEVIGLDQAELDLSDLSALTEAMDALKPNLIVNASAYTAVDRAEEQRNLAFKVNAEAPAIMAEWAKRSHIPFIHFSTDYVFDGVKATPYVEEDTTNPLNVYGQSKLEGEQAIGQVGGAYVILRTSWVYSIGVGGFVSKVLSWARNQETLRIVTDQIGSPTWARMLAEVSTTMIGSFRGNLWEYFRENSGVYHLGGAGSVSRFEFTQEILRLDPKAGEQKFKNLEPALTADFPTQARRPLFTSLDCSRFERIFGLYMPNWRDALRLAMGE